MGRGIVTGTDHGARLVHGHANRKRGHHVSPTYSTWTNMRTRCENPKSDRYKFYGARGVAVCDRWRSFENFLADMGEKPAGLSLDRINSDGNYQPDNCRWATHKEQSRNRRSSRPVIRSDGCQYSSMAEAAEVVGGNRSSIYDVCTGRRKTYLGFGWSYA